MKPVSLWLISAIASMAAAFAVAPPDFAAATTALRGAIRPLVLPFLWRSLAAAQRGGDEAETFDRARTLLLWLPRWTDGHLRFAYRWTLDGGLAGAEPAARAAATLQRLRASLTFMQELQGRRPDRQVDLLESMAFLVELAARNDPALAALMRSPTGFGTDAALLADGYLAAAMQHGAGRTVREQRIFAAPRLCAAMLRAGDRARAIEVADLALAAVGQVADPTARSDWQQTLALLRAFVADQHAVPPERLRADPALAPLLALQH